MGNKLTALALLSGSAMLAGCAGDTEAPNTKYKEISVSASKVSRPEGGLMSGIGITQLLSGKAPAYQDAANPSAEEIRARAIFNNYVALVDNNELSGFGSLYGPTSDKEFPGKEYLAYIVSAGKKMAVTVWILDSFDSENACIVAGPPSGSRGIYGAVGTAGAFAMEHNCVLTMSSNGKGTGVHWLTSDQVYLLDGTLSDRSSAGANASFAVEMTAEVKAWADSHPNRAAVQHAHSQANPEQDWGVNTLDSIRYAFKVLNEEEGVSASPDNTLVIATSASNGGGAALKAGELDKGSLLDAIVVSEPNINPLPSSKFVIKMGERADVTDHSRPLFDYGSWANLYAECAALAEPNLNAPFGMGENAPISMAAALKTQVLARCDALIEKGLLTTVTLASSDAEKGAAAQSKMSEYGFLPEGDAIMTGYGAAFDLMKSLTATYANAYTKGQVQDPLCNISFSTKDLTEHTSRGSLADNFNGIPRSGGLFLINEAASGGPVLEKNSVNEGDSSNNLNLNSAVCFRNLWTDESNSKNGTLKQSISAIQGNGDLGDIPVTIVHGRSDALIPVNHSSRPYFGLNKQHNADSSVNYYEITNAQHLDTFNSSFYAGAYVPLDYYYKMALEQMWAHLTQQQALMPSQVVSTTPPGAGNQLNKALHLPALEAEPEKPILFQDRAVFIPE